MKSNPTTDKIFAYLVSIGMTRAGAAGFLANLWAESECSPSMVEGLLIQRYSEDGATEWRRPVNTGSNQTCNNFLYTTRVNSGAISKEEFLSPRGKQYGYGLAQWTTRGRKLHLWKNTRDAGKSIADLDAQLLTLREELTESYAGTLAVCRSAKSAEDAAEHVLRHFEAPRITAAVVSARRKYAAEFYEIYGKDEGGESMISNSGHDENGKYSGGKAGDQTGGEWAVINWYDRPWKCVLRHPDPAVRSMIAEMATAAAKNNHIGYDQSDRYTFWQHLKASDYDPAKITVNCEADCSAGVAAIVKAVGYRLNRAELKAVSIYLYTGNMRDALKKAGFEVLTASKYLTGPDYLLRGDILLNDSHHVATNLTDGKKASVKTPTAPQKPTSSGGGLNKTPRFTAEATVNDLQVRTWAGTDNANIKSWPVLNKGNRVDVCDTVKDKKGRDWYYVRIAGKYYGFVAAWYMRKI